jgi:hypothetical protein
VVSSQELKQINCQENLLQKKISYKNNRFEKTFNKKKMYPKLGFRFWPWNQPCAKEILILVEPRGASGLPTILLKKIITPRAFFGIREI